MDKNNSQYISKADPQNAQTPGQPDWADGLISAIRAYGHDCGTWDFKHSDNDAAQLIRDEFAKRYGESFDVLIKQRDDTQSELCKMKGVALKLQQRLAALETVVAKQKEALMYLQEECTFAEPSLSVMWRKAYEAIVLTPTSARDKIVELEKELELYKKFETFVQSFGDYRKAFEKRKLNNNT